LEVGAKTKIHNNGLLGKRKTDSFYLDVGRIRNLHFFIVPVGILSPVSEGAISSLGGGIGHIALCIVQDACGIAMWM